MSWAGNYLCWFLKESCYLWSVPMGSLTRSHVMQADDIMIFCKGTSRNVHNLINFFQLYKDSFGQVISKHKSKIFIGSIPGQRLRVISDLLQYFHSDIPFNYFGVPIFKGKPTRRHLYCVADKIKCKLASWKGSILSIMGRIQLVNSVIHGMLLYSFSVYAWQVLSFERHWLLD